MQNRKKGATINESVYHLNGSDQISDDLMLFSLTGIKKKLYSFLSFKKSSLFVSNTFKCLATSPKTSSRYLNIPLFSHTFLERLAVFGLLSNASLSDVKRKKNIEKKKYRNYFTIDRPINQ
ncbi:hypothetical protein BpHYR1_051810 [Brachionus plicatilis]|uniref:Uncharacterized protein n=1 Tax=Brachionus plicatilis TaxID=10195 RepID=A0A3M7QFK5_BRAPC|nr:hypothetical protein BpHYR1_051810 [Brachionus plicatilis]